jgi:plasmid stability protein
MRTTITIDDDLFEALQARAREKGLSVSALVRDAIRSLLAEPEAVAERPFRLVTFGVGGALPGVDLDRTSNLLAAEDEARYGER